MKEESGFTREMATALDLMSRAQIPMNACPAVMVLEPHFRKEWIRFLWRYRRRSPFLFKFMAWGSDFAENLPRSYIQRKIEGISSWIHQAKEDFKVGSLRFYWDCVVLDHKARPKHWRPPSFSREKAQRESFKNGEGIFMPGMSLFFIEQGLWCIFANQFEKIRRRQLRFASFDFGLDIGFSAGVATTIARFDINYTAKHAHAYPVSRLEAAKHPLVSLDDVGLEIRRKGTVPNQPR